MSNDRTITVTTEEYRRLMEQGKKEISNDSAITVTMTAEEYRRLFGKVNQNKTELEQVGNEPSHEYSLEEVMKDLNALAGLANVKKELEGIFNVAHIYGAEDGSPGFYIFQGNPGTGKTTTARLMGRAFKAMGLLSKGHTVEVTREDLLADYVGATAEKTLKKCKEALGGVLFFDEAYSLMNTSDGGDFFADAFAQEAFNTLITFAFQNKNEFCLICAGYADRMTKFVNANPGIESKVKCIDFPDYSADELFDILLRMADKKGFSPDEGYKAAAKEAINAMLRLKTENFGNAREMEKFLDGTKKSVSRRMQTLRESGASKDEIDRQKFLLTAADIPEQYKRKDIDEDYADASAALHRLIGLRSVKEKIHTLVNTMKLELANPADNARKPDPGKYVFLGNPGTGKTEVARLFGRLLYSIGLLSKGHLVEVKREDLVAGVIGQTAQKTLKKCKEALGGVLLIDEAYSLIQYGDHGGMDFGREALDTILIFMEDNRHSTCVIFAGYPDRMEGLIEANPAIQSRISRNNFIDFPDYSAEELSEILKLMIEDRGKKADEEYYIAAESVFAHWTAHKDNSYGNAREVRNLVQDSVQQAANRLLSRYENPKDIPKEEYNLLVRADLEANYLKLL